MDTNAIITTALTVLISAAVPSIVTAVFNLESRKQVKMHSAKQSILQMILEDRMRVDVYHHLPENYQAVMKEFDVYTQAGGNSYVHDKVVKYEEWYKDLIVKKDKEESK